MMGLETQAGMSFMTGVLGWVMGCDTVKLVFQLSPGATMACLKALGNLLW